jgi:hypothetical protein
MSAQLHEVVPHEIKGQRVTMVLKPLRETVRQPSEAAHGIQSGMRSYGFDIA